MAKIFSGITLLVALAAIFFAFQSKDMVGKLRVAADRSHDDLIAAQGKLKKAEKELAEAKDELGKTKADLAATADKLKATETDLAKNKADLAAATEKVTASQAQYDAIKKQYDELTVKFPGTPEDIAKKIMDLETSNKELAAKAATLENDNTSLKLSVDTLTKQKRDFDDKLASQRKVIDRYQKNIMVKGVTGQVLAVNAGWGFCVLSVGDRRGAAANKIMVVVRGGQAIGKVKIVNVEASQSVADIIPSSFVRGTYVEPGDEVIYTGDDKVREEPVAAAAAAPAATTPSPTTPAGAPELPHL